MIRLFCRLMLWIWGFKQTGHYPKEIKKKLYVVYPHTSNWDFPLGMLFKIGYGLPANWIGKTEMFPWPLAGLLKWLGGIPVDRKRAKGFLDALLAEFRRRDWIWVAIAPEGTRSSPSPSRSSAASPASRSRCSGSLLRQRRSVRR